MAEEAKIASSFVYRHKEPNAVQHVWRVIQPADMILAAEHIPELTGILPDQIEYEETDSGRIAHMLKQW